MPEKRKGDDMKRHEKGTDLFSCLAPVLPDRKGPYFPAQTLAVKPFKRQKRKSPVSDDEAFS